MTDSQCSDLGHKLDIVDEEWAADTLSDGEIELPPDIDSVPDENDIESVEMSEFKKKEEEKWNDLALDNFEHQ